MARKQKWGEPTVNVAFRVPESKAKAIKKLVSNWLNKDIGNPSGIYADISKSMGGKVSYESGKGIDAAKSYINMMEDKMVKSDKPVPPAGLKGIDLLLWKEENEG